MESAQLFLYLFRRFGPPIDATDDYKSAAAYCLTTPRPDVFLRIEIKGDDRTSLHFAYAVTKELGKKIREEDNARVKAWHNDKRAWWEEKGIVLLERPPLERYWSEEGLAYRQACDEAFDAYCAAHPGKLDELHKACGPLKTEANEALLATIRDLQRPTRIRDIYITPLGRVENDEFIWDEVKEKSLYKGLPAVEFFRQSEVPS
jgi:hypothetical protein